MMVDEMIPDRARSFTERSVFTNSICWTIYCLVLLMTAPSIVPDSAPIRRRAYEKFQWESLARALSKSFYQIK